jgi:hypothetical protein
MKNLSIFEERKERVFLILGRDFEFPDVILIHILFPINRKGRIIPDYPSLKSRIIDIVALIEKLGIILKSQESMSESSWNEEHFFIHLREEKSFPLPESRRVLPEVDHDIIDRSCRHTYELRLRFPSLKMESTEHSLFTL